MGEKFAMEYWGFLLFTFVVYIVWVFAFASLPFTLLHGGRARFYSILDVLSYVLLLGEVGRFGLFM